MAKFEDYVQRQGTDQELESEINEAASNTEQRQQESTVPDRFKGKTPEEIAASYVELERTLGRQANELGELRNTVKTLAERQNESKVTPPPAPKPVTMDELYETPDEAVRRVVREESTPRIDALEKELEAARQAVAVADARRAFEVKHPTYKDTMADPSFLEWIKGSNMRLQLAQAADKGNFDAADELFSTYTEIKQLKEKKPAPRSEEARRVALERSGGSGPEPVEKFSRFELQEKRIAAKRGDRTAQRWLTANGDAIRAAYAEDRLTT